MTSKGEYAGEDAEDLEDADDAADGAADATREPVKVNALQLQSCNATSCARTSYHLTQGSYQNAHSRRASSAPAR